MTWWLKSMSKILQRSSPKLPSVWKTCKTSLKPVLNSSGMQMGQTPHWEHLRPIVMVVWLSHGQFHYSRSRVTTMCGWSCMMTRVIRCRPTMVHAIQATIRWQMSPYKYSVLSCSIHRLPQQLLLEPISNWQELCKIQWTHHDRSLDRFEWMFSGWMSPMNCLHPALLPQ